MSTPGTPNDGADLKALHDELVELEKHVPELLDPLNVHVPHEDNLPLPGGLPVDRDATGETGAAQD